MKLFIWVIAIIGITNLVYALDRAEWPVQYSVATGIGSVGNTISFLTGSITYINRDNDSTMIGNYFTGSYYDSTYGFFKMDHSGDLNKNIRIVGSTDRCPGSYGYRLGGTAYSTTFGYIRFDPSTVNFVYFCESDKKLRGFWYSSALGWQNFNGLSLQLETYSNIALTFSGTTNDPFFLNNRSSLGSSPFVNGPSGIQGDLRSTDLGKESVFYIVK